VPRKVQAGLLALVALTLLTSCRHSHAASGNTRSTTVQFVTPNLRKAQLAVARHVLGHVPSEFPWQRVECHRYGTSAMNCFVLRSEGCTVVGVRETVSGEIRYSEPFGLTICAARTVGLTD
jgi:hypothetical protein